MQAILKNNLKQITILCKANKVTIMYAIGSVLTNEFTKDSDVDFIINYERNNEGLAVKEFDYFDMWFGLEKLLNRKVDLICEDVIRNKYFKANVDATKKIVYEKRD
jgi:uncharacterized protein